MFNHVKTIAELPSHYSPRFGRPRFVSWYEKTLFSFPSRLAYLCYTRVCLPGTIFFDLKLRKREVDSLYLGLDRSCTEVLGSCIGCTHSPVLQVIFTLNYAVCIKVRNRQQCLDPGASIVLTSENSVYRNVTINVLYGAFEFC